MNWSIFRPTRWKFVFSALPLLVPALYLVMSYMVDSGEDIINLDVSIFLLDMGAVAVLYIGYPISLPFKPLLTATGLWEQSSHFFPSLPTFGGYLFVSLFYFLLIYVAWSVVAAWRRR